MKPAIDKALKTACCLSRNILRGEGIFPFYASYKVTSKCALRCSHCDLPRKTPTPDADTTSAKEIIENIASSSPIVLAFEGGEPLLRDDIEELLEHARRFPLFVSVVTSYPEPTNGGYARLARFVHFLQVSIDEGHGNLALFGRLHEMRRAWRRVCVQTVVTAQTMDRMEEKARRAEEAGCRILFLPLTPLGADMSDQCPERFRFGERVRALKRRHPKTIVCSSYFLASYVRGRGCTSSSVVIDSDGSLFYPCHILEMKPFSLLDGGLDDFLLSAEARALRARMKSCSRACGWYQYFALSMRSLRDLPRDVASGLERMR